MILQDVWVGTADVGSTGPQVITPVDGGSGFIKYLVRLDLPIDLGYATMRPQAVC